MHVLGLLQVPWLHEEEDRSVGMAWEALGQDVGRVGSVKGDGRENVGVSGWLRG